MKVLVTLVCSLVLSCCSIAQQIPDTAFTFPIRQPAYQKGEGPLVLIDQAHHNFHTISTGFYAFGKLLDQDGYVVQPLGKAVLDIEILKNCEILVIANALNLSNVGNWVLPTPSAFSNEEIKTIRLWVKNGGSLFLIADHMPFAGSAYKLGRAFGFEFLNGFAFYGENSWPPMVFSLEDQNQLLQPSPIVTGIKDWEKVDSIATFLGSAFGAIYNATPVLSFIYGLSYQPDTAFRFHLYTPWKNLEGYHQGAIRKYGLGKVAVFGEAAMFTAQVVNDTMNVGFNSHYAPDNAQFTLNLIHWLDGVTEYHGEIVGSGQ